MDVPVSLAAPPGPSRRLASGPAAGLRAAPLLESPVLERLARPLLLLLSLLICGSGHQLWHDVDQQCIAFSLDLTWL